jgi:uncharacterized protein
MLFLVKYVYFLIEDCLMSNCCDHEKEASQTHHPAAHTHSHAVEEASCCEPKKTQIDWLLWGSLSICLLAYVSYLLFFNSTSEPVDQHQLNVANSFSHAVFSLLNTLWWGVLLGILFVGLLARIPQNLVISALGQGGSKKGLLRAIVAGIFFDLCSHGILMVGMKLYQKGASLGQVMAFLIASPWNSLSLTLIMVSLIGFSWTLAFILLSMVIAFVSGWIFDGLVKRKALVANPYEHILPDDFRFWPALKDHWNSIHWHVGLLNQIIVEGLSGARMVLRWLLFGVVLAALIRTFISLDVFQNWFGPSIIGLILTLIAATIIEVCSEGSTPIAADLLTRAKAPGNSFTFMMAGVATDYTEIMSIKDTMQSWKIALFLPLVTLPQIVVVALVLNQM